MEANRLEHTPAAHLLARRRVLILLVVLLLVILERLLVLEQGLHLFEDFIFLELVEGRDAL